MGFVAREGLGPAILLIILPFVILFVLIKLFPPRYEELPETGPAAD